MRVFLTGARGFVGSNLACVFADRHGAELIAPAHSELDLVDPAATARAIADARPDAVVHAAIWNDPPGLRRERRRAWAAYVEATRNIVDGANTAGAPAVLISTDWVFDGAGGLRTETDPPCPVNTYGFLKTASELVVTERSQRGAVARIAGVQGVHRAQPSLPRSQDAGFGYFVAALADALRAGEPFTVWDGPDLNVLATPTLATDAGELVWRALERFHCGAAVPGVLHCCGGEGVDRLGLARRAALAFGLDPDLIRVGEPPAAALGQEPIPYDTRLDATATAAALGVELPTLDAMLGRLRAELDSVDVSRR